MNEITSVHNENIKTVTRLTSVKERYNQNLFLAEGTRTIKTILTAGTELHTLYSTHAMLIHAQKMTGDSKIILVSDHVMEKISSATTPSGLLATFVIPPHPKPDVLSSGLILANISDPGNMGTLIRTSVALNRSSIVLIGGVDPYNPKVVQASAGTITSLRIFRWSWHDVLTHKGSLQLAATVISGGAEPKVINADEALLVIGSEAHGLTSEIKESSDVHITLPMPGPAESLNAAIAGSIIAYLIWSH
ncbi:RNA methyltransferase [Candidatus Babeliales bacterium]|nr:RNA methyltransferase [Candidatus Babeliales bacterium]